MRLLYILIITSSFLLLIGKPHSVLSEELGAAYTQESAIKAPTRKIFLNVKQAVDLAFRNNRTLMFSDDSVKFSQYSLESAETEFELQPTPRGSGGWSSQTRQADKEFGFNVRKNLKIGTELEADLTSSIDPSQKTNDLDFTITQPLLRGFGYDVVTFSLTNAERSVISSERTYQLAKERLAADVIRQYYEIVKQEKILEINETALKREKIVLESAKARLSVGLASRLDVSRAEIQVQQAEDNLINARENLGNAQDSFKITLNVPVSIDLGLAHDIDYPPFDINEAEAIATAMKNRLDLIEESDRIWDSKRNLKVQKNNLWPELDLVVGYTLEAEGDTIGKSFDFKDGGLMISFQTSATNLNRKSERAAYKSAQVDLVATQRSYNLLMDEIIREVRDGIRALEKKYKSIPIQQKALEEAKSGLAVANERYKRNLADNFDIVDAEASLLRADTALISAITDYIVEHTRFRRTIGTLTEKPAILLKRRPL